MALMVPAAAKRAPALNLLIDPQYLQKTLLYFLSFSLCISFYTTEKPCPDVLPQP